MIFICLNVLVLVHPHLPTPFTSNPVIWPRCWYSYFWRSWYLSTPSLHPCTRTPVIYLRCWPDNIHVVFECFDTFYPPTPSLPLHPKLSDLMDLVKIIFRSDNKVHFHQFVCHGKWLSLAGPHASFYWFPRDSLRWLFSAKQCTNFQNIVLNFSSPVLILFQLCWTCHGLTWIFSHQAQKISEKEDLSYLPSYARHGTVMSMII